MKQKTENIISIILPVITIFVVAIALRTQTTGLAVYSNHTLYRLNGSISITLEEDIPADSYIGIKIDNQEIKINIIEFLKKSGKSHIIRDNSIIADGTYAVDFASLGIIQGFEKGKHVIRTEIINKGSILHSNEETIEI